MLKGLRVVMVGGGLLDYIVSYLSQVIVIVIGRPRSLTIYQNIAAMACLKLEEKRLVSFLTSKQTMLFKPLKIVCHSLVLQLII